MATNDSPTMFLRDYITISDNLLRPVNLTIFTSIGKNIWRRKVETVKQNWPRCLIMFSLLSHDQYGGD